MVRAAAVILALTMVGCAPAVPADKALQDEVHALDSRITALELRTKVAEMKVASLGKKAADAEVRAVNGFELVVTWPEKGGNDFRHSYETATACEAARQAIFAENKRRYDESQAALGKPQQNGQGGWMPTTVAVGAPPSASAVCLPQ